MQKFVLPMPKDDTEVILILPGGDEIKIELLPSCGTLEPNCNGVLAVTLPKSDLLNIYQDGDGNPSDAPDADRPHERFGQHIVAELPGEYGEIKLTREN